MSVVRPFPMAWLALVLVLPLGACSGEGSPGAPEGPSLDEARADLAAALETREVEPVAAAARAAARYEGQDPALDHLIGDALANVLMKPSEGLPLLTASPSEGDPAWERAILGAALRAGTPEALGDWPVRLGRGVEPHPVLAQLSLAARQDPAVGWELAEEAVAACTLLDAAPQRGRQPAEGRVPDTVFAAAQALGAEQLALGRPDYLTDPDPLLGERPFRCRQHRWVETLELPDPLVLNVVVAARRGEERAWLWVGAGLEEPEAIAASSTEAAARWLAAATLLGQPGDAAAGAELVRTALGEGLLPPESP